MSTTTLPVVGRAARLFHALSDETRLEIVRLLSHGERCVCELQDVLDAAQSRLSFHLKTLKDAGLVTDRREGRWIYYALNREALDEIAEFASVVKPGSHVGSCRVACCT
jgi:ArsR family transcriptional regulator